MIILDKPFVSEFLKNTVLEFQLPVLENTMFETLGLKQHAKSFSEKEVISTLMADPGKKLYTNSENAIAWIGKNLYFTEIPSKINLFKDKIAFRDLLRPMYPHFNYTSLKIEELDDFSVDSFSKPFIIKPAVGFFSMGVYKVDSDDEWPGIKQKLMAELKQVEGIYPSQVMDAGRFIIEQIIEGDEYAIDVYYDNYGNAVVMNIMQHIFASATDFSDRLYITSEKIIRSNLEPFTDFLQKIGNLAKLSNFPMHVEVRVDSLGQINPIEVNPMRFGAWCTTADATWFAYGYNSIATYLANEKPDWDQLFKGKEDKIYSMMVLENSTGCEASQIKSFDYEKLLACFEKPLDLRRIDYRQYPVFGFLFTETREENYHELEYILKSRLNEFIELS
jgi:hypothetical protein